ncbi:MAG TPA: DUF1439 domain-containing protein [Candidatus Acidoferrales bacterium]|jgi:hypothetical protein|nr:DUF1439 domain-containing protein [Candidatus Acidoferrales bacterium]
MKRATLIAGIVLVLVILGAWLYFPGREFDVTITQQQIDDALQAHFPVTKTNLLILHVTYSNPHATLLPESGRIEVGVDAALEAALKPREQPKKFTGTVVMTTGLSYRYETKQFFLADPKVSKLTLQGVPQQYLDKSTNAVSAVIREQVQKIPVYTIKPKNMKTKVVRLILKDVQIKDGVIHATLGI